MTEERIKKLLKERIKEDALVSFLALVFLGIVGSFFGGYLFFGTCVIVGIFFYIKLSIENRKEIKNIDNAILFLMYPDKEVLIKVMDEIIDHPVFKGGGIRVSEHFILYGDRYENIIRLYDVKGINITKLNDVYSRVDIEDRFGQKKKIKIETPKAEELYNYLSLNCKNAVIGYPVEFIEGEQNSRYIDYDCTLTEEYCFYEGDPKKQINKASKNIVGRRTELRYVEKSKKEETKVEKSILKEEQIDNHQAERRTNKKSRNMDQKYNDLKKLKELLDSDILTKEEYEKEKSKILSD